MHRNKCPLPKEHQRGDELNNIEIITTAQKRSFVRHLNLRSNIEGAGGQMLYHELIVYILEYQGTCTQPVLHKGYPIMSRSKIMLGG